MNSSTKASTEVAENEDRDKVFYTYKFAGQQEPGCMGSARGTGTITGGTGKTAGIQSSFEMTRTVVRSSIEGIGQICVKSTTKYTLP